MNALAIVSFVIALAVANAGLVTHPGLYSHSLVAPVHHGTFLPGQNGKTNVGHENLIVSAVAPAGYFAHPSYVAPVISHNQLPVASPAYVTPIVAENHAHVYQPLVASAPVDVSTVAPEVIAKAAPIVAHAAKVQSQQASVISSTTVTPIVETEAPVKYEALIETEAPVPAEISSPVAAAKSEQYHYDYSAPHHHDAFKGQFYDLW